MKKSDLKRIMTWLIFCTIIKFVMNESILKELQQHVLFHFSQLQSL